VVGKDGHVNFNDDNFCHSPATLDIVDWNINLLAPMTSSINIGDVNSDGIKEIVATTFGTGPNPYGGGAVHVVDINGDELPGWPFYSNKPFPGSAAIGDVDLDGDMEIAAGCWNAMYLLEHDGTIRYLWPQYYGVCDAPVMADLDLDDSLEIIYSSGQSLYVKNWDGSDFGNFPVTGEEDIGSPSIGDIDSDGMLEIVAGTYTGPTSNDPFHIYAWRLMVQ